MILVPGSTGVSGFSRTQIDEYSDSALSSIPSCCSVYEKESKTANRVDSNRSRLCFLIFVLDFKKGGGGIIEEKLRAML